MAKAKLEWQRVLTPRYLTEHAVDSMTCQCYGGASTKGTDRTICGEIVEKVNRARVDGMWADIWQCVTYTNHRFATRATEHSRMVALLSTEKPVFGAP